MFQINHSYKFSKSLTITGVRAGDTLVSIGGQMVVFGDYSTALRALHTNRLTINLEIERSVCRYGCISIIDLFSQSIPPHSIPPFFLILFKEIVFFQEFVLTLKG